MSENRKRLLIDILIVFVFTLLGFFSYFKTNIAIGDDLTYHLNRIVGLSNAFEERQILPKIYPYANYEFGYASPLFYCDLFLYPFAILYHFGLSAIWCYKLCVIFYTLISNISVYLILRKETNKRILSLLGTILYFSCNYHLLNIFIRCALGEILAISFIPLVIYSIYRILIKKENAWIYLGVSFSFLVMSHLISTLLYSIFFFVMIIVFIIFNWKDKSLFKNTLLTILKGTLLALLLCAWYIFPMLEQLLDQTFWLNINPKYNFISGTIQSVSSILNLFVVSLNKTFDINQTASIGLPIFIFGLASLFINNDRYINVIIAYCLVMYLIMFGVIPGDVFNSMQFYFRFYVVVFPLFVVCCIYVFSNIDNKKLLYVLFSVLVVYCMCNIVIANTNNVNNEYVLNNNASIEEINHSKTYDLDLDYNHDELGGAEYLPYSNITNYNNNTKAINHLDINGNYVEYSYDYTRYYSQLQFSVNNSNDEEFMLPISYYKGYKAYELIDNNWVEVELGYSNEYKLLTLNSSEGNHTYKIRYAGTLVQHVSLIISALSLVGLVFYEIKGKNDAKNIK